MGKNDEQGAWAQEGRIEFFVNQPQNLRATLLHTAGNGNIIFRVNCNEFVENIRNDHNFVLGQAQNTVNIRATVPPPFHANFDQGLQL